jgi:HTH-type transcriptional regulator / antitoxin HipB
MMHMKSIGTTIREARRTAGRTQADLAASLGMSRATISAIENGTIQEIGVRKLAALCAAVGLDIHVGTQRRRPTLQELRAEQRANKFKA